MRRLAGLVTRLAPLVLATDAFAHGGGEAAPGTETWELPLIVSTLLLTGLAYLGGLARARLSTPPRWPVARWRIACFAAEIALVALALLSPLDTLSETYFSAPLFAVSDAHLVFLRMFPLAPPAAVRLRDIAPARTETRDMSRRRHGSPPWRLWRLSVSGTYQRPSTGRSAIRSGMLSNISC